jgi:hypothetical protein
MNLPQGVWAMASIQIFDPVLCCSSGVCGVEVDQALLNLSADLAWASKEGAKIVRFNLAQQPMAFAEHLVVKRFLDRSGVDALPVILVDGEIALAGRYPQRAELARWAAIPYSPLTSTPTATSAPTLTSTSTHDEVAQPTIASASKGCC